MIPSGLFIIAWDEFDSDGDIYSIEILFNNIAGLANSEYVHTLASLDSRFHKLGYYIKHYVSKFLEFTKQEKLNSFSLISMLIVFLQSIADPPVLPKIIKLPKQDQKLKCIKNYRYRWK